MSDASRPPGRPVLSAAALAAVRPDAPPPLRLQAARGEAPLAAADRLAAMAVLAADADPAVRQAARERLAKGPVASLLEGVTPQTDPRILDILARARGGDPDVADCLLRHPAVPDAVLDRLAAGTPGRVAVAVQDRAVPRPQRTRIARAMERHAAAASAAAGGRPAVVPAAGEPGAPEAPPKSQDAEQAPEADLGASPTVDELEAELDRQEFDALLIEEIDEHLPDAAEKRESLYKLILSMAVSQKIQLAFKGNKEARGLLVKDPNKLVSGAVLKSPKLSESEIVAYAQSRSVSAEVFRGIVRNKDYAKLYPIRLALASNPRVPVDIALHCLGSLHESDVAALAKNRNVSSTVQAAARRAVQAKADKERQKHQQLFGGGH